MHRRVKIISTRRKWLWAIGIIAAGGALVAFGVPMQYVLGGFLLLCPLMMFFMGGHNMDDGSKKGEPRASSETPRDRPD